jgi:hypothetical protein
MSRKLEKAVNELFLLVAQGIEFPDATAKVTSKYKVSSRELIQAYDQE